MPNILENLTQIFKLEFAEETGDIDVSTEYFSTLEKVTGRILELSDNGYIFSEYKISTLEVD